MILAFSGVDIDVDNPKGSDRVSTIDDAERLTRLWLKSCMQKLSGYEDGVETISVLGWNNNTKPRVNTTGKYLLGYNTSTGQLEIIGTNGNAIQVVSDSTKKSIALLAHPVGTYYWTSSTSFNPNTAWGGTWVRVQDGRCLISNNPSWGNSYKVGHQNGDTRTVQLQAKHLPVIQMQHYHGVGTYEITGSIKANDKDNTETGGMLENITDADNVKSTGALSVADRRDAHGYRVEKMDNSGYQTIKLQADSKHGFTGNSGDARRADNGKSFSNSIGEGIAHNNMPPYTVGVLWHRTA